MVSLWYFQLYYYYIQVKSTQARHYLIQNEIFFKLHGTILHRHNPLWNTNHKYKEYFQNISLGQFLIKHTNRNVVLVIHLDIFNHIIIIFKSSQHRHGIAPFRMRFFQITWYNFEYHLRCVCVAQALKFFLCFDSSSFLLQTPMPFWSCKRF